MKRYHVQLTNVDEAIQFIADANPEMENDPQLGVPFLIFKRDDEVVGRFRISSVVGWWSTR